MKYSIDDFRKPSPYGKFADPRYISEDQKKKQVVKKTNKKKGQK